MLMARRGQSSLRHDHAHSQVSAPVLPAPQFTLSLLESAHCRQASGPLFNTHHSRSRGRLLATYLLTYRAPGRREKATYLLFGTTGTELRSSKKKTKRRAWGGIPADDVAIPSLASRIYDERKRRRRLSRASSPTACPAEADGGPQRPARLGSIGWPRRCSLRHSVRGRQHCFRAALATSCECSGYSGRGHRAKHSCSGRGRATCHSVVDLLT